MSESAPASVAAIEVTPSYSAWSFLLGLCKPRVAIDGVATTTRWAPTSVTVAPGAHQVEAWTAYLSFSRFGRNGLVVNAVPGTLTRVTWRAPMWAFSKGKVAIAEVVAIPPGFTASAGSPAARPEDAAGQLPVPGMTAPAMGLTPNAPWTPTAPYAAGRVAPVAPAGWHPDPAARHQLRWFDGTQWTNHVSDDGVATTDEGISA